MENEVFVCFVFFIHIKNVFLFHTNAFRFVFLESIHDDRQHRIQMEITFVR